MSKQLTVRLPDDLVEFIDGKVAAGEASSRASVVAEAVAAARRAEAVARDVAILATAAGLAGGEDGLDDLAAFAARTPLDDLG